MNFDGTRKPKSNNTIQNNFKYLIKIEASYLFTFPFSTSQSVYHIIFPDLKSSSCACYRLN